MGLSDLSLLTLVAAVALFITSQFARRTPDETAKIHVLRKVLSVVVLSLVAVYFLKRFTG